MDHNNFPTTKRVVYRVPWHQAACVKLNQHHVFYVPLSEQHENLAKKKKKKKKKQKIIGWKVENAKATR